MNLAAGRIAQRQSGTLIAALRTRVADQSSDACQYFRIIAEGRLPFISLSLSLLFFSPSLLVFSLALQNLLCILFLLLRAVPSFFFYVVAPVAWSLHAKPNERRGKAKGRGAGSIPFFKATGDDALMRPGLCGWTKAADFARDRRG